MKPENEARLIDAKFHGDVIMVPSGTMYFEERPASRDGVRFTLLVEPRHNARDINAAKRILRNSRDAVKIIVDRL